MLLPKYSVQTMVIIPLSCISWINMLAVLLTKSNFIAFPHTNTKLKFKIWTNTKLKIQTTSQKLTTTKLMSILSNPILSKLFSSNKTDAVKYHVV